MKVFDYISEGGKNFLRTDEAKKGNYIVEMLIHNNLGGFVGARLKSRNGENSIVYPMNGLIPLTQVLEMKKMSGASMESLLLSFLKAMQSMEDYLLPAKGLITEPEHIYQNFGKKEEFLWIYGGEETKEKRIVPLFEYLLNQTDYSDDRAVNLIYTLYQSCKNYETLHKDGGGEGMLVMLCEKIKEILSTKKSGLDLAVETLMEEENRTFLQEEKKIWKDTRVGRGENEKWEFNEREPKVKEQRERKKIEESFSVLQKGEGKESGSRKIGRKNEIEKKKGFSKKNREKKRTGMHLETVSKNMGKMLKKAWGYLNAEVGGKEESPIYIEEENEVYKLKEVKVVKAEPASYESKGTTLLTNGMVQDGVYCLSPEENGEESAIITSYPYFIGKAKEDIHFRLEDSTVSRYHARIDRLEDEIWLTDLGSTNGTFLNGTRLIPFERLKLLAGDRIVLSRKRYTFLYLNEKD